MGTGQGGLRQRWAIPEPAERPGGHVPFTRADEAAGDRQVPIQAYLRMPAGEKPEKGWPVLLFICGLDAYKTDHTFRTQIHVGRGFATLSFEIPGTGDCPAAPNDPASPDRLMSSVLGWVDAQAASYGSRYEPDRGARRQHRRLLCHADRAHTC